MSKKLTVAADAEIAKFTKKVEELKAKLEIYETQLENLKLLKEKIEIVESIPLQSLDKPVRKVGRPRKKKEEEESK